jgi:hypothetical protein
MGASIRNVTAPWYAGLYDLPHRLNCTRLPGGGSPIQHKPYPINPHRQHPRGSVQYGAASKLTMGTDPRYAPARSQAALTMDRGTLVILSLQSNDASFVEKI